MFAVLCCGGYFMQIDVSGRSSTNLSQQQCLCSFAVLRLCFYFVFCSLSLNCLSVKLPPCIRCSATDWYILVPQLWMQKLISPLLRTQCYERLRIEFCQNIVCLLLVILFMFLPSHSVYFLLFPSRLL